MFDGIYKLVKKIPSYLLLIKFLDLFGAKYEPRIFSKNKYKSVYGAILSILLYILIIYKIYQILQIIISKTDYSVTIENSILDGENQILGPFYLTFCINVSINNSYIFSPMKDYNNKTAYLIYNKSNSDFFGLNCYSYNLNKLELSAKSELGDYNKNIFGIIKKEYFTKNEELYFLPDFKYVQRSDYHNPLRSKNFNTVIKKINNINKIDIYLQTIQIIHKNTIDFGFKSFEFINSQNYTSYSHSITKNTENNYYQNNNEDNVIKIRIFHSDIITTYIFTGFKLDQLISNIGGYISCWMLILNLIGQKINNIFLNKEILKELNKKDKTKIKFIHMGNTDFYKNKTSNLISSLISKNNLQIDVESRSPKRKISVNINNTFIKKIKFAENNSSSQDKSPINNLNDSNKLFLLQPLPFLKNINPIVLKERKKSKFNSFNLNKDNISNCLSNSKFEIQKIEQEIKNSTIIERKNYSEFKKECNDILNMIYNKNDFYKDYNQRGTAIEIDDNQKEKFATKLFRNFMDYGMIFNCMKELKILELILLDETNAKLFMEQKDYIYDLNKLIILSDNKKLQPKLFSSMKNKEYALKQCII